MLALGCSFSLGWLCWFVGWLCWARGEVSSCFFFVVLPLYCVSLLLGGCGWQLVLLSVFLFRCPVASACSEVFPVWRLWLVFVDWFCRISGVIDGWHLCFGALGL